MYACVAKNENEMELVNLVSYLLGPSVGNHITSPFPRYKMIFMDISLSYDYSFACT